jgi:hypothetical protein
MEAQLSRLQIQPSNIITSTIITHLLETLISTFKMIIKREWQVQRKNVAILIRIMITLIQAQTIIIITSNNLIMPRRILICLITRATKEHRPSLHGELWAMSKMLILWLLLLKISIVVINNKTASINYNLTTKLVKNKLNNITRLLVVCIKT